MIRPLATAFAAVLLCTPVNAMGCSGDHSHKNDGDSTEKTNDSADNSSKKSGDTTLSISDEPAFTPNSNDIDAVKAQTTELE